MKTDLEILIAVLDMTETKYTRKELYPDEGGGVIIEFSHGSRAYDFMGDFNRFIFTNKGACVEREWFIE